MTMKSLIQYIFLSVLLSLGGYAQNPPKLTIPEVSNDQIVFDFQALKLNPKSKNIKRLFKVYVDENDESPGNGLPIHGTYNIHDNKIIFTPDFPFWEGQSYVIQTRNSPENYFEKSNQEDHAELVFSYTSFIISKKRKDPPTRIVKIFPSSDVLAENILRFYIYFSTPMKREVALHHIHLVDENGNEDIHAFMKFKQELWSPDGKRLTLLFDPGRIKRNVATNLELGPALTKGKAYQLIIDASWESASGEKLEHNHIKHFTVGKAYRTMPNPKEWEFSPPTFNSLEELVIHFDRIYDQALVKKCIEIRDQNDNRIKGEVILDQNEKIWIFRPYQPWSSTKVDLVVKAKLEDIAGNNLQDLLDHTVSQGSKDIEMLRLTLILKEDTF